MTTRRKESLDEVLENGKLPLLAQLQDWIAREISRGNAGPWTIRATFSAPGAGSGEVFRAVLEELDPNMASALVEDIRNQITSIHGPDPIGKFRVQAYEDGKSADPGIQRMQDVAPNIEAPAGGLVMANNEFSWGIVVSQYAQMTQMQQNFVAMAAQMSATNAALADALAQSSTLRSVASAGADAGSSVTSLVSMGLMAFFLPDIMKILEERQKGNLTLPTVLGLFKSTFTGASGAASQNKEISQAVHRKLIPETQLGDGFVAFDEEVASPTYDRAEGMRAQVDDEDDEDGEGEESEKLREFLRMAEGNPALIEAFVRNMGPEAQKWANENLFRLMMQPK